jgi:hypothetical protein
MRPIDTAVNGTDAKERMMAFFGSWAAKVTLEGAETFQFGPHEPPRSG